MYLKVKKTEEEKESIGLEGKLSISKTRTKLEKVMYVIDTCSSCGKSQNMKLEMINWHLVAFLSCLKYHQLEDVSHVEA